ncbi:MAG: hypothetical protein JNN07_12040 [Verrucomicrobiales bacterium]|nr:hypothetical protein [Verrucomicrobiales bacterium]
MPRSTKSASVHRLAVLIALVLTAGLARAQSLSPVGDEYPLVGSYVGDQMFSAGAYQGNYGFVVWQDSAADGKGSGIVARQLSAGFSAALSPAFRVNQLNAGDQEKPKVGLFADGSAVFCWDGGEPGRHKIYARFLSKKGIFSAAETVVSQSTTQESLDVGVSVLKNGNAVLVWSTFGADGDLQGVFGRIVDSTGKFLGGIFQVNEFSAFNQRNSDVTALDNGGFAVCWISEQQRFAANEGRGLASIDTYARVFSSTGEPMTGEFRVNRSNSHCANPSLSSTEGGQLIVAWSERSSIRSNGWEIVTSTVSLDGVTVREPSVLNTYARGNQIVPSITRLGALHLVTWTSTGQDGSQNGVYARYLRGGVASGDEFRVNSWTPSSQVQPVAISDGVSQAAIVFSTFLDRRGFDLHAQRYSAVSTVPQPEAPFVGASSLRSLQASWPALTGYDLAHYELSVDGNAGLIVDRNHYSVEGLVPGSTHQFKLRYILKNGEQSLWSASAAGRVWGEDTNGDGIPDDWQTIYWGSDAGNWADAAADSDGDGASNLSEFRAGTLPLDGQSVLKLGVAHRAHATVLTWNTVPGYVYQVQVAEGLPAVWKDLGTVRFARETSDSVRIDQQGASNLYRVVRLQ